MSIFCPNKECKRAKGACSHEKWMITAIVIVIAVLALGKSMNWF